MPAALAPSQSFLNQALVDAALARPEPSVAFTNTNRTPGGPDRLPLDGDAAVVVVGRHVDAEERPRRRRVGTGRQREHGQRRQRHRDRHQQHARRPAPRQPCRMRRPTLPEAGSSGRRRGGRRDVVGDSAQRHRAPRGFGSAPAERCPPREVSRPSPAPEGRGGSRGSCQDQWIVRPPAIVKENGRFRRRIRTDVTIRRPDLTLVVTPRSRCVDRRWAGGRRRRVRAAPEASS